MTNTLMEKKIKSANSSALILGKFFPPTREHERLIRKAVNSGVKRCFLAVLGPNELPFDRAKRGEIISRLSPLLVPIVANNAYDAIEQSIEKVGEDELVIFGGTGERGMSSSSKQGASISEIERIISKFPNKNVSVIGNERGLISATYIRNLMKFDLCVERIYLCSSITHDELISFRRYIQNKK